jgi:hypothetical protein
MPKGPRARNDIRRQKIPATKRKIFPRSREGGDEGLRNWSPWIAQIAQAVDEVMGINFVVPSATLSGLGNLFGDHPG